MSFTVSEFGRTSKGELVNLYTLKNSNGLEAGFINLGGVWVSMLVPDKDGKFDDVVLGYDTAEDYEVNKPHLGAPIGRNSNRIAGGLCRIEGKEYKLAVNSDTNSLHSGPDYWHNRIWKAEASETSIGSKISFTLKSPDMDQGFPGNADVSVSYTLAEDNSLIIEYNMQSDKTTVCNLTNHSYFNLAGHKNGNILNHEVWIDADRFTPADSHAIPTGELREVKDTPMDFTIMKRIGDGIDSDYECTVQGQGYDHNWVINRHEDRLVLAAKVRDYESGRLMKVYTDLPGVQFYTANFLDVSKPAKDGAIYKRRCAYCFETQFFPNAVNMPEFDSPVLKAGDKFNSITVYKFTLDNV